MVLGCCSVVFKLMLCVSVILYCLVMIVVGYLVGGFF